MRRPADHRDGAFTSAAVDQVITAVRGVLGADELVQALKLAEATMDSDGASQSEKALLAQATRGPEVISQKVGSALG